MVAINVKSWKLPTPLHIRTDAEQLLFEHLRETLHQNFDFVRLDAGLHFLQIGPQIVHARTERMNV